MQKTEIKLHILLPEVPDERDECVQRIIAVMQRDKGVEKAHVVWNGHEANLCFHYNPDIISIDQIQALAHEAGATILQQFGHLLIEVEAFRNLNEATGVEHELRMLPGMVSVSVSAAGFIRVEYDQKQTNKQIIMGVLDKNGLAVTSAEDLHSEHTKREADDHDHDDHAAGGKWRIYAPVAISLAMLLAGIVCDQYFHPVFFTGLPRFIWYAIAYLPVGFPVARQGIRLIVRGDVFTEFVLMTIATIGAFCIGDYPEGVTVMVFYTVGELFQDAAVNRAKRSIKALLDIRPSSAFVKRDGNFVEVRPEEVRIDDIIQIKAGEKVPLDSEMLSEGSAFNTAALTGESRPSEISKGEPVLAGMINQDKVVELKVVKLYNDSSLARILSLVQEATTRKAKTEQFIRKFSRIYTPIVVFIAIGIATLPYFFVQGFVFNEWLYRALIFLVISCPCALVISIPLGYFGGIGAASRNGILFKGSNFLDLMTKVTTVVMDKTGTLTKGVFKVQEVKSYETDEAVWLPIAAALEAVSTHPVAQAVVLHVGDKAKNVKVDGLEEISGHGIKGVVDGKQVFVGNLKLMAKMNIAVSDDLKGISDTIVAVAIGDKLVGYITIADEIKEDSKDAIKALHDKNIETIMLSGDKQTVVDRVAKELGIDKAFGDLLPETKVKKVEEIKRDKSKVVVFVGDGINDAPVLALSDVGMAMGGLGSDAAIETADVIIQTDQPSRIAKAIHIGKATNNVVWQNIIFAFVVKGIVMALGISGKATMWEAVFADVGVALLAVLNAMRIQRMKF